MVMAKEIERKFLVKGEFRNLSGKKVNIIQAYLSTDPERIVRLRIAGDRAFLTLKSFATGKKISRNEWEIEIPVKMAEEIIDICVPGRVNKTRYYIPFGIHVFEVDEFHGKNEGLVVAEIELSDENEVFEKPEWLGEEVTGRPEYQNSNLIK